MSFLQNVIKAVTLGGVDIAGDRRRQEEADRLRAANQQLQRDLQKAAAEVEAAKEVARICGNDAEMLGACSPQVAPTVIRPTTAGAYQIGLFGLVSGGKSSLLNALLGKKVAAEGIGEVTLVSQQYSAIGFDAWDTQGMHDANNLLSQVPLAKAVDIAIVVLKFAGSLNDVGRLLRVLHALKKRTVVVVNKVDQAESAAELDDYKKRIQAELEQLAAPRTALFFVSARAPGTGQWAEMVDCITTHPQQKKHHHAEHHGHHAHGGRHGFHHHGGGGRGGHRRLHHMRAEEI